MSESSRYLQQAVRVFESHGITNDIEIAEAIGALLTQRTNWDTIHATVRSQLMTLPLVLARLDRDGLEAVINHLRSALAVSPFDEDLGLFYQREIRHELLKDQKPPQYPTPHHIADFMAALAVTDATTSVCDPTAGSGGLLAATLQYRTNLQTIVGCDYDPSWMGLGYCNLICHGLTGTGDFDFRDQSGLFLLNDVDRFDCVVMNPPFNGSRSVEEVEETVGGGYGTSLVNVMGALAVQLLIDGGRTAFLMPSGVLFGSGTNANLRALWLQHNLEAVVSLDRTCFQPYSSVSGHVILLQKREQEAVEPDAPVWCCDVNRDGYPEGATRDLTADPTTDSNELPRTRELVTRNRDAQWPHQLALSDNLSIEAVLLQPADGLAGIAIRSTQDFDRSNLAIWALTSGYLVRPRTEDTVSSTLLYLPSGDPSAIAIHNGDAESIHWSQVLTEPEENVSLPDKWTLENQETGGTVELRNEFQTLEIVTGTGSNRKSAVFNTLQTAPLSACLLDGDGKMLSPWFGVTEAPPDPNEIFGVAFGGSTIFDSTGGHCGWLIPLLASDDQGDWSGVEGKLLVVNGDEARLSKPTNGGRVFGHLSNGFVSITPAEPDSLWIETGAEVSFPEGSFRGFAFGQTASNTHVFAALVPRSRLLDGNGVVQSFENKQFLPQPPQPPVRHPADVVADIRRNQTKLSMRVDTLLQVMGSGRKVEDTVSPLFVTLLGARQREIWRVIETWQSEGAPRPFSLAHLVTQCRQSGVANVTEDEVGKFLELAVGLGLIIPIHVGEHNLFRVVQTQDYTLPMTTVL